MGGFFASAYSVGTLGGAFCPLNAPEEVLQHVDNLKKIIAIVEEAVKILKPPG